MALEIPKPDLSEAEAALSIAEAAVNKTISFLKASGEGISVGQLIDQNQVVCYELSHAAAGVKIASSVLEFGSFGDAEAAYACVFAADAVWDLGSKIWGRESEWGLSPGELDDTREFVAKWRDPKVLAAVSGISASNHLDSEFEMVSDTFRKFAENKVAPVAEHIHRKNGDIPEEVIEGLAEMGGFGLSVPSEYGGFASGGEGDYMGMVVATEELSRASLGVGGSLITRPEILTRALVKGGTEEQKQRWLPKLATAEILAAVAVTEPDFGSDVAGLKVTATPDGDGWRINGVKTWCTFGARADVLMLLARTDPDRSKAHRGLSLFVVPKPRGEGEGFSFSQEVADLPEGVTPGKMEGRPIDTLGYRGMHSYELAFDNWYVSGDCLIGGEEGLGKGFYFQMEGFENGRLQTAARAVGVMQAALEAAWSYAENRVVFGSPIFEYQLTKAKLARMAVIIQAARQFTYYVARLMAKGEGALEASMVKAYVCRAAEWVTREALQIHGGMGYAEEFPVSRYFVDARVLSIFEGADETLALKVVARRLLGD